MRWIHLLRVSAYPVGLFGCILAMACAANLGAWVGMLPKLEPTQERFVLLVMAFAGPAFLFAWWCAAARLYLRIPHAEGVAAVQIAAAWLAVALLDPLTLVDPIVPTV